MQLAKSKFSNFFMRYCKVNDFKVKKSVVLVFDRYDLEKLSKEFSVFISEQAFESSQF